MPWNCPVFDSTGKVKDARINAPEPFTPASLTGIWSWTWAGENGENVTTVNDNFGPKISVANDLSGNGRTYYNDETQQGGSAEPSRPAYQVGATLGTWETELPTMAVDSFQSAHTGGNSNAVYGQLLYQDAPLAANDFYLAGVFSNSRTGGDRYLFGNANAHCVRVEQESNYVHIIINGTDIRLTANGSVPGPEPCLLEIWRSGTNLTCFINGNDATTGTPTSAAQFDVKGVGGFMDGDGPTSAAWDDFAFEYVVCDDLPTAAERADLRHYLNPRWDLFDPLSLDLMPTANVTYLGSFKLPEESQLQFGPQLGGIAYNEVNDSIFCCGYEADDSNTYLSEFSIPTLVQSSNYASLNTATRLQPWVSACGGNQDQVARGQNGNSVTGLLVYDGKLYISVASVYLTTGDPEHPQTECGFYRDSLNLSTSSVVGPFAVGAGPQRAAGSGIGGLVPDIWQSAFGSNPMIWGGGGGLSIVSNDYSNGPHMIFCDPAAFASGVTATRYPSDTDIGATSDAPFSSTWTWNSEHRATIMLPDYRTLLAFGFHADTEYVDSVQTAQEQARSRFWLYDIDDVKDGFDGTVAVNAVAPYGSIDFAHGGTSVPQDENTYNRGGCWDPTNRRVLEVIRRGGANSYPMVNVYGIA